VTRAVRFHPAAREELRAAIEWYEEREAGLGAALLDEVDWAIGRIAELPEAWPISPLDPRARYLILPKFPYRVIYLPVSDPVVIAIAHQRRRPGYWRDR
jgi:plasmid stabilization system protein ParE